MSQNGQRIVQADAISIAGLTGFGFAIILGRLGYCPNTPLLLVALTAIPMVLLEWKYSKLNRSRIINERFSTSRFCLRLLAFYATLAILAALYFLIPEYLTPFYTPFRELAYSMVGWLVCAAIPYFCWIELSGQADDGSLEFGQLLIGQFKNRNWVLLKAYGRAWAVKAFFIPLMIVFTYSQVSHLLSLRLDFSSFIAVFAFMTVLFFTIDVIFGTVGYLFSSRFLHSEIKSTEPTVFGWLVTLLCYPPFNVQLNNIIFQRSDGEHWQMVFSKTPVLFVIWGFSILVLEGVYCWATVSFGIRFSNLTNRCVIMYGPYRYLKHPAYLSKNMVWWLSELPFLSEHPSQACRAFFGLLLISCLYYARARTEENHLMNDPQYQLYSRWIRRFGLVNQLRQSFGFTPRHRLVRKN